MTSSLGFQLKIEKKLVQEIGAFLDQYLPWILLAALTVFSIAHFFFFYRNGLGLAYNDARSHLDIGRRVVEGLKPGLAQLGSVWLPLPHVLMIPTIWHDFMWHSGLAGALQSMVSFVVAALTVYFILRKLGVGLLGRIVGVGVFATNLNILYLQSTAMTELLLIATMILGSYFLLIWYENDNLLNLIKAAFWIMLSTLIRYDGWFLFFFASMLVVLKAFRKSGYKMSEGLFVLFCTLGGFGIFLWVMWNLLIFKDPLYFAFGPYSAHAQQAQLESAGVLATKGNWWLSLKIYWYAMAYNSGAFTVILGIIGAIAAWRDKHLTPELKIALTALIAPLIFNVLALYLGHSVLFIQGLSGNTWFNVRYGIMMMPSLAVFIGLLIDRIKPTRWLVIGLFAFTVFLQFVNGDAVTIDDGRVGSSQKNVSEVSRWLGQHTQGEPGFILISAASHDAIIFSSGLPMKKFIHEGTGAYWESATTTPDRWARWIVMRTNDENDQTFKLVKQSKTLDKYDLVESYPFADIYQLKPEFLLTLQTQPVLGRQR